MNGTQAKVFNGRPVTPSRRLTRFAGARRSDDRREDAPGRRLPRVLLVEDEDTIRELVSFHLRLSNCECLSIADGQTAKSIVTDTPFDLIILDVVLPGVDGLTLCLTIRREGVNRDVPILMLTARADEADRVIGLDSGADDYLIKPFGMRELMARVRALLRRPQAESREPARLREQPILSARGITIDPTRRKSFVDGVPVGLTRHEFELLYLLMSHPGVVFDRQELMAKIWTTEVFVTPRGVDALVKRLRRKIEVDPAAPQRLLTAWGTGYKFGDE